MSLTSPNLDDRDFGQLVEAARLRIAQSCPEWSDLSPHDPGIVLLEVFAYLTDTLGYRLNRLPEKAYVEFLRLLGVTLQPPAAASVRLHFTASRASERAIEIPRGTRIAATRSEGGGEAPVFTTAATIELVPGAPFVEVTAHHCDLIVGELAGTGSGLPGLTVRASRPPIVSSTGSELDLVVGVEASAEEMDDRAGALEFEGRSYRIWREVSDFGNLGGDRRVFVADRMQGIITFAPAARLTLPDGRLEESARPMADVPGAGRAIRLWYRRGGGQAGNVAANTVTVLKDPIPGVDVTNPERATGGQAAETLENAVVRGPAEFFALRRAVTARDFELIAERWGAVARARATTKAQLWTHARPGTVEVLLVPAIPEDQRPGSRAPLAALVERQTTAACEQIQRALDEQRPLGTTCLVSWARYKSVRVRARVVAHPAEDLDALRTRILERLHASINPLPNRRAGLAGWRFGEPLRAFHVYDMLVRESGVQYVERVTMQVDDVPQAKVKSLAADAFQPRTWYAAAGSSLFRSLNDGDSWETAGRFTGEEVQIVKTHPEVAGCVVVTAAVPGATPATVVRISLDCGETWRAAAQLALAITDVALTIRENVPVVLLATDKGLYELVARDGATPIQVLVDPANADCGFYAVAASTRGRGGVTVAAAAQSMGGVFVSSRGGQSTTFALSGLKGQDVRELGIQYDGPRMFLWAGQAAAGGDPGKGCLRQELLGAEGGAAQEWRPFADKWEGGSCRGLTFAGSYVFAATHRAGVLRLDSARRDSQWETPDVRCGLPLRDVGRLHPVDSVASDPDGRLVLAAGVEGVYRSANAGVQFTASSRQDFEDEVQLPPTWLICSGEHEIEVVSSHASR